MKRILAFMCALFMASCTINLQVPPANVAGPAQAAANEFDIKQAHKSVASVFVKQIGGVGEASGTAFAIDKDHLITAGHVCVAFAELQDMGIVGEDISLSIVRDGFKSTEKGVEILEIDEPHDACLLRKVDHGLVPLEFVDDYDKEVKFGDDVYIVGAPLGFMVAWQEGHIMDVDSQKRRPLKGKMIASFAAAGGNSGSPILNSKGKVIGVLVMGDSEFDHLSICVKSSVVKRFLKLVGWPGHKEV